MLMPCPNCGERSIEEFSYAGDASLTRPSEQAPLTDFVEYVYMRNNPAGPHEELWYHAASCRQFVRITRDTRTHGIEPPT